jgi:GNAT superfamily N-acetyltransferase
MEDLPCMYTIMMQFRKALEIDTDRIWEIIQQAQAQMRELKSEQWQNGYPAPENIVRDIRCGYGYVLCREALVIAYGAVIFDGEPAYNAIDGAWLSKEPYVVVHRLAVADGSKQQGVATKFMHQVEKMSRRKGVYSFRIDTKSDNHYMLKMLSTLGFSYCGTVRYDQGLRQAYEKIFQSRF